MKRTSLTTPGDWVFVRELGSVLGGMCDEMVDRFLAGAGVTVERDWAGRKVIAARDAAIIVADRTAESRRNAELVAKFDRYLAIYNETRRRARQLAFSKAYEAMRQRELRALQTPGNFGYVNGLRILNLAGKGRYSGSPQCRSVAQDRARTADQAFARDNPKPLGFGPWRDSGAPDSPIKNVEKAIDAAVEAAMNEGNLKPHV